jgi:hypothetical protein
MTQNQQQQNQLNQWLAAWQAARPVLERLRADDIRQANTAAAIESLDDAFESARRLYPPVPTSGLIEQQYYFSRWKP